MILWFCRDDHYNDRYEKTQNEWNAKYVLSKKLLKFHSHCTVKAYSTATAAPHNSDGRSYTRANDPYLSLISLFLFLFASSEHSYHKRNEIEIDS